MAKKLIAIRVSEESLKLLKLMAEKHSRSQANMIEYLIKDAAIKEKLTDKP